MAASDIKNQISSAIQAFAKGSLTENAMNLFKTLGYNTGRRAQEIDDMVYKLYGLTEEEIKMVERK